jgi:hypothetical protein
VQIVLHLAKRGLQGVTTNTQGDTGGQDVDDHQVQQAGHHRAVFVESFRMVGTQMNVSGACEGRAAGGDDGGGCALLNNPETESPTPQ